jgi:hypothetical protein
MPASEKRHHWSRAVNLICVLRQVIGSTVRYQEELLSVFMTVATAKEIKPLFLKFQSAGLAFFQTLKSNPEAPGISPQRSRWESAAVC